MNIMVMLNKSGYQSGCDIVAVRLSTVLNPDL